MLYFNFIRKGAPFSNRFQNVIQHLEDAGVIHYWTEEVISRRIKVRRAKSSQNLNIRNTLHVSCLKKYNYFKKNYI